MATLSSWPEASLGDAAQRITVGHVGPMADQYLLAGIPFLRSLNVAPYRIDRNDLKFVSREFHERLAKSALRPGDVVVVRTGRPGTAAVIPENLPEANCSDLVVITPGEELDARFLAYYLNSAAGRANVDGRLVGSVQAHFNIGDARRLRLRLPPIATQRAIADILGALDDKIELNRRMNETLEATARAMFKSWFVDFDPVRAKMDGRQPLGMDAEAAGFFPNSFEHSAVGPIPKGWRVGPLGEVASIRRRGIDPSEVEPGTAYVGLEHMPRRSVALAEWGTLDGVVSGKFAFRSGEILFGELRPYFHKVTVAPVNGVCSTDILVIAPKSPAWFGFVLLHSSSDEMIAHADATSSGTRMPRTSWKEIARYEISMPPEPVAVAFEVRIRPMFELLRTNIAATRTLAQIRDALLPRLVTGELRLGHVETPAGRAAESGRP